MAAPAPAPPPAATPAAYDGHLKLHELLLRRRAAAAPTAASALQQSSSPLPTVKAAWSLGGGSVVAYLEGTQPLPAALERALWGRLASLILNGAPQEGLQFTAAQAVLFPTLHKSVALPDAVLLNAVLDRDPDSIDLATVGFDVLTSCGVFDVKLASGDCVCLARTVLAMVQRAEPKTEGDMQYNLAIASTVLVRRVMFDKARAPTSTFYLNEAERLARLLLDINGDDLAGWRVVNAIMQIVGDNSEIVPTFASKEGIQYNLADLTILFDTVVPPAGATTAGTESPFVEKEPPEEHVNYTCEYARDWKEFLVRLTLKTVIPLAVAGGLLYGVKRLR